MLEAGVAFPVVAMVMGWSAATTVRMAKRYGHIGHKALRNAVDAISAIDSAPVKNAETPAGSFDNPFDLNRDAEGNLSKV
jgi:succinyl-CoA synthetase alpha subunit